MPVFAWIAGSFDLPVTLRTDKNTRVFVLYLNKLPALVRDHAAASEALCFVSVVHKKNIAPPVSRNKRGFVDFRGDVG